MALRVVEVAARAAPVQRVGVERQRFQEAPVLRRHFGVLRCPARQSDRGVELQHDVESGRANSGDGLRDPLGIRDGIVNGVSQLSQQLLHPVNLPLQVEQQ